MWPRSLNAFGRLWPFSTERDYASFMPKIGACGGLKKAERVPGTRLGRWLLFSVQRSLHCLVLVTSYGQTYLAVGKQLLTKMTCRYIQDYYTLGT